MELVIAMVYLKNCPLDVKRNQLPTLRNTYT